MLGNMQEGQLLISGLIEHAETYHKDTEIVSRSVEGPIHRYTLKMLQIVLESWLTR